MKKIINTAEEKDKIKQFYNCLYSYSHCKFRGLLKIQEIAFLFQKMVSANYIDTFISKHATLAKNSDCYKICAKNIISTINEFHKA
jgi:hypothetical protein